MAINKYERNKSALLNEKHRIQNLVNNMDDGVYNDALGGELSVVDNHPADIGEEIATANTAQALKQNEKEILFRIDKALQKMDDGSYGVCSSCGEEIPSNRLEVIPHAEYCIDCQNNYSEIHELEFNRRPLEESVLDPFNSGFNDFKDDPGFDGEDAYQAVESFNYQNGVEDYYYKDDEYVEPVDGISNEYYRNQLQ